MFLRRNRKVGSTLVISRIAPRTSTETLKQNEQKSKPFLECSNRTKRKRVGELTETYSAEELSYAASMALRKEGKRASAQVLREVAGTSSQRGRAVKKILYSPSTKKPFNP